MPEKFKSKRAESLVETISPLTRFTFESKWAKKDPDEACADLTFGNPHEMPLSSYVDVLKKVSEPKNKDWFAYKQSIAETQEIVSRSLRESHGQEFQAEDICMTNGAIAALDVTIKTISEAGDEIIFFTPQWFLYEGMIIEAGAKAVKIPLTSDSFDLDIELLKSSITSKTRAVIVNSPHNPSGKIFSKETLFELSEVLKAASAKNNRTIYLISDEAYRKIVFDDNEFVSPATFYKNTFIVYTYGKVHLTPGQRIGYIALPETMEDRDEIRKALNTVQLFSGWAYPNAILQYGINHFENLSIDIGNIQQRRDVYTDKLREMGYKVNNPQGTFYLLVESPIEDDWAFVEQLADHGVYCLPGLTFSLPGYFRISLTANDEMVQNSLRGFRDTLKNL